MNKIFKLSTCGKNKWMSVVVNTSNDEKQVCSVHHGVHKNSYSPCGGWYNASTGPLVALVTQCFDTFCVVKCGMKISKIR